MSKEILWHRHHIVPKHLGGSDCPSNIIRCNIAMHAFLHKLLWEKHGRWQDRIAWMGLSKLYSSNECRAELFREAGRKSSGKKKGTKSKPYCEWNWKSGPRNNVGTNNPAAKEYEIIHPCGTVEIIRSLKTWCEENGLKYNSFQKATICRGEPFQGFFCRLVDYSPNDY